MAITTYMNLDLPEVLSTLGPDYAEQNNTAFETIDLHDHSSGKGKKVPTSGIDINANLNFQSKKAYNLYSAQLIAQGTALTGSSNALSISTTSGDLYYTNGAGNSVQITSGGSVVSVPASASSFEYHSITSDLTISPSDTFVMVAVDTSAPRTVNLPLASTVAAGRIYVIKDSTGSANTNAITVAIQGSDTLDGQASYSLASNYGSIMVIGDGSSKWLII